MKLFFVILSFFFFYSAAGNNFYVDPSSQADAEKGTIDAPWKGFAALHAGMASFRPGDTIFFKRNELYFEKLNIKCSGTQQAPIVFTAYGEGNSKPLFMFKPPLNDKIPVEQYCIRIYKSSFVRFEGLEISDDHINPEDHSSIALIKIAFAIDESNAITIRKCDISRVGIGVNMVGNNNLVEQCKIFNLRMVRNTEDGYDDYGANGVVVAGNNNVISDCIFMDCWANSYDFEFDGGAIEMAGPQCSDNRIINNFAFNCNGFMEMGSTEGGILGRNLVEGNTVFNCGDLLYINNDGPYAVGVQQLELTNNRFIQTIPQLTRPKHMISMAKVADGSNIIVMRGNIFWLPMKMDVAKQSLFLGSQMTHTGNIYYLEGGKLNFPIDPSERILDPTSTFFKQSPDFAPFYNNLRFFPFKYILKYWYLVI